MSQLISSYVSFMALVFMAWVLGLLAIKLLPPWVHAPRRFLALPIGLVVWLTAFALLGEVLPNYSILIPASFLIPLGGLLLLTRWGCVGRPPAKSNDSKEELACFAIFLVVTVCALALQAYWPALHWVNSRENVGVEKLFNLSLQQSFLRGEGVPPNWLWLPGEKIHYYHLSRALPGLASWIARSVFGNSESGGYLYLLSGAFYTGLAISSVTAWMLTLLAFFAPRGVGATRLIISVSLSLLTLFANHFVGLQLGIAHLFTGAPLDWWNLQEQVVPFTQNQYPVWLLILGDHHSYSQVMAFQITVWGLAILLCCAESFVFGPAVLLACAAFVTVRTHAPSILVDVVTIGLGAGLLAVVDILRRESVVLIRRVGNLGFAACLFTVLFALSPQIASDSMWRIPPIEVVSPLFEFLSVQFWPLCWIVILITTTLGGRMFSLQALGSATGCSGGAKERNILEWWCVVPALACALAYIFTRPALYVVGVVILLVGPLSWCARGVVSTRHQRDIGVLAVASLGVWILPEFLAFDLKLDDRQTWMRFNTVLRFWPEGYYLIPFVVTLAFASPLCDTLHHHTRRRWRGFFPCAAGVLVLTFGVSHIAAIKNREFRYAHPPSLNGADFIAREAAVDAQIIAYLSSQSNERKMVLGEGCGTGVYRPTPVNYSWPGRFSTFSGWPGMCGWSRHVQLHNPRLAEREWDGSRQSLHFMQAYESAYLAAVSFAGASLQGFQSGEKPGEWSSTHSPESLRHVFTTMGVTHLVFGESEGNAYGRVSLATLAQVVGGRVEFRVPGTEFGVVEIGKG